MGLFPRNLSQRPALRLLYPRTPKHCLSALQVSLETCDHKLSDIQLKATS